MNVNESFQKYPYLFFPYQIEYLFDIYSVVNKPDLTFDELKSKSIEVLKLLFEFDILYILGAGDEEIINEKSIDKIIQYVDHKWTINTQFPEIYDILFFGYNDWYVNAFKKLGFDVIRGESTGITWLEFIENIDDFEKWINENKPT